MAKSGNKGSIIVDSSCVASRVTASPLAAGIGVYAASKAGANMLMKYAAIEVRACSSRAVFCLTLPSQTFPESIRVLIDNLGKRGADNEPCPFHDAACKPHSLFFGGGGEKRVAFGTVASPQHTRYLLRCHESIRLMQAD